MKPADEYEIKTISRNDILDEAWRNLRFLEVETFSRRKIKEAFPNLSSDKLESKSRDLNYLMGQARDYFHMFTAASMAIKPILLYYGTICLEWAFMIMREETINLREIRKKHAHHGLKVDYSNIGNSILNLTIKNLKKGLPHKFAKHNKRDLFTISVWVYPETGPHYESKGAFVCEFTPFSYDAVNLSEIIGCLPDLYRHVRNLTDINAPMRPCQAHATYHEGTDNWGYYQISFDIAESNPLRQKIEAQFPKLHPPARIDTKREHNVTFYMSETPTKPVPLRQDRFGRLFYVIEDDEDGRVILPELLSLHLTLFCLCDIARYRPEIWSPVIRGYSEDTAIVEEFLETCHFKIPVLIYQDLFRVVFAIE